MTAPPSVARPALGMLRNFGPDAAAMAEKVAAKFSYRNQPTAAELWAAIASEIRRLIEIESPS